MRILITNGTIVTADGSYQADVLVDGETIAAIGTGMAGMAQADETIDATGRYVIPGGIDVHTHMELPFGGTMASDDFQTGTVAAAFGGTTSIVDFAVQGFGEPLEKARDAWMDKARGKALFARWNRHEAADLALARSVGARTLYVLVDRPKPARREGISAGYAERASAAGVQLIPWAFCAAGKVGAAVPVLVASARAAGVPWVVLDVEGPEWGARWAAKNLRAAIVSLHAEGLRVGVATGDPCFLSRYPA